MSKTIAIVQASRENRSPDPKIFRKVGGKTLLELLIRRATECQHIDGVVVILAGVLEDDLIRELVPSDVPLIEAHQTDSLSQVLMAAHDQRADAIVRICADNPFVDPALVDRLIITADEHPSCDYIGYCRADGRPAILSPMGVYAEWCTTAALELAHEQATHAADRADATRYIYSHPKKFQVRLIPAPAGLDRDDFRLKLDHEDDWDHAQVIFETLGADEFDWQQISGLLNAQPDLRRKMAVLNQASG
jgi:spore coat polysaccharide biosynthesis protein SpsF